MGRESPKTSGTIGGRRMEATSHDFSWRVPAAGFRWAKGETLFDWLRRSRCPGTRVKPDWFLVPRVSKEDHAPPRDLNPYSVEPDLFRTFAGLAPTRDQVLSFANQFGMVGRGVDFIMRGEVVPRGRPKRHFGESLST